MKLADIIRRKSQGEDTSQCEWFNHVSTSLTVWHELFDTPHCCGKPMVVVYTKNGQPMTYCVVASSRLDDDYQGFLREAANQ